MAGESLSLSELRDWYSKFDAVVKNYGGGALSELGVPDGGTVVTSDINNLYNQITAFRKDTYFKTEPTLYPTDYSIIGSGTLISRNVVTPITTTIAGISQIKCRNQATNTSGINSNGTQSSGTNSSGTNSSGICGSGTCGSGTCGSGTCSSGGYGATNSWTANAHGTLSHGQLGGACTQGEKSSGNCAQGSKSSGTCTNLYNSVTCGSGTNDVLNPGINNAWSCVCFVTYNNNISHSSGTKSHGTQSHNYCQHGKNNVTCSSGKNSVACSSGTNDNKCGSGTNQYTNKSHTTCNYSTHSHGSNNHGSKNHGTNNHGTNNHGAYNHGALSHGALSHGSKAHSTIIDILNTNTTYSNN